MKYIVDDETFEEVDDVIDFCMDADYHWDDDGFEEWVNELESPVQLFGCTYYVYDILRELDDAQLNELRTEYCEEANRTDEDEARHELYRASDGDVIWVQGYRVECVEEELEDTGDTDGDEVLIALRMKLEQQAKEKETKTDDGVMQIIFGD